MTPAPVRIVLAEDHPGVRAALVALLERGYGFAVVGEAEDGERALELVKSAQPDIVLMDLNLPCRCGLEAIRAIASAARAETRCIAVTMRADRPTVDAAFASGALGYVLKNRVGAELVGAIHTVRAGQRFVGTGLDYGADTNLRKQSGAPVHE